jgi:hypothetical protein
MEQHETGSGLGGFKPEKREPAGEPKSESAAAPPAYDRAPRLGPGSFSGAHEEREKRYNEREKMTENVVPASRKNRRSSSFDD